MRQFKRNPFVVAPGTFWANRKHLWQRLMETIELSKLTRTNEIIVLVGDYGCGTTHTLRYLEGFLKRSGAFVSYFTTPVGGDLRSLFRSFLEDIPEERKKEIIEELTEELIEKSGGRMGSEELGRLPYSVLESTIFDLISGSKVSFRQKNIAEDMGIPIEKLPSITVMWSKILSSLVTGDWPVFVLIDEFDAALSSTTPSQELLYDLRRLYDETLSGLCIVIGLKGEPKDVKNKLGGALLSRMALQPVYLDLLSRNEALDFIKDLLRATCKNKTKPLLPFTEESAKTVADLCCPCTPRKLLRFCSVVFEEARKAKKTTIETELVTEIATRFGGIFVEMTPPKRVGTITKHRTKASQG
jgi:energy-coupling factor transporter ATP-binding protein EcfA2